MRIAKVLLCLSLTATIYSCTNSPSVSKKDGHENQDGYQAPEVPVAITEPLARANYRAENYWNRFDFADTSAAKNPQTGEQAFVDFIDILLSASPASAEKGINLMLEKALNGSTISYKVMVEYCEKYLNDPNSPFRNEDFIIPVLKFATSNSAIDDAERLRAQHQLRLTLRNRPGAMATDFTYTDSKGATSRLYDVKAKYTILFFNNPDCPECARIKGLMNQSSILATLLGDNELAVLAVYPDNNMDIWKLASYPFGWKYGYDKSKAIRSKELYNLQAIPTIYLLDKDKKVILKDKTWEQTEAWLADNALADMPASQANL